MNLNFTKLEVESKFNFIKKISGGTYLDKLPSEILMYILSFLTLYKCDRFTCGSSFLDKPYLQRIRWCFLECSKYDSWSETNCGKCRLLDNDSDDSRVTWRIY